MSKACWYVVVSRRPTPAGPPRTRSSTSFRLRHPRRWSHRQNHPQSYRRFLHRPRCWLRMRNRPAASKAPPSPAISHSRRRRIGACDSLALSGSSVCATFSSAFAGFVRDISGKPRSGRSGHRRNRQPGNCPFPGPARFRRTWRPAFLPASAVCLNVPADLRALFHRGLRETICRRWWVAFPADGTSRCSFRGRNTPYR